MKNLGLYVELVSVVRAAGLLCVDAVIKWSFDRDYEETHDTRW